MTTLLAIIGGILGLAIGSFLNVVAYRVPIGRSVVSPPSACPSCSAEITSRDNIPVLSWLLLRGKCRNCAEPISPRYAVVELTTGVLFAITPYLVGPVWAIGAYWWFAGVTVTLVLTDLDHKRIPNRILFPGTIVGAVLLVVAAMLDGDLGRLLPAALGGLGYFTVMLVIALIARGGFGFGDVKLSLLLGMFLGYLDWQFVGLGFFLAFFFGGVVSILLLVTKIKGRKDKIPFGPYLVLGTYLAIAFGDPFLAWYLR